MKDWLAHWKTTSAGVGLLLIVVGRLLHGDGVSWEEVTAALAGLGLLVASDASKT